jgi:S-adenosylmethionine-diacylglycerol 3-amino-3-carboxypropyl transferase
MARRLIVPRHKEINARTSFDFVRYANCWEDAQTLTRALDTGKNRRYMSIASAGDNALAILILNPEIVVAVDISQAQLACVELRKAAFKLLSYDEMLWFLGFRSAPVGLHHENRNETYNRISHNLPDFARSFWDARPNQIQSGIIYHGKFERYFGYFRKYALPLVHGRRAIDGLLENRDRQERECYFETRWNTWRWRLMFRMFFSRAVMGRSGRDPEFFRYVKGNVAGRIFERTKHALTDLPTHDNPFLRFILNGAFDNALPMYAQPEYFKTIKNNIDRLETFNGTIGEALGHRKEMFDGFNLSDIFEYMDPSLFSKVSGEILSRTSEHGRIAYWNMLAHRKISEVYPEKLRMLKDISLDCWKTERAFFYKDFFVEEVIA